MSSKFYHSESLKLQSISTVPALCNYRSLDFIKDHYYSYGWKILEEYKTAIWGKYFATYIFVFIDKIKIAIKWNKIILKEGHSWEFNKQ